MVCTQFDIHGQSLDSFLETITTGCREVLQRSPVDQTSRVERSERLGVDRQLHNETPQDWGQGDTHVGGGLQGNGVDHTVTEVFIDTLHPLESLLQAHRLLWKPFSSAEG